MAPKQPYEAAPPYQEVSPHCAIAPAKLTSPTPTPQYSEVAQADQDDLESQPSPSHHHGDTDATSPIPLVTSVITTPHEHCEACERIIARREQRQNQLQCCGMVAIVFVMLFICATIFGAVFARAKAHDD